MVRMKEQKETYNSMFAALRNLFNGIDALPGNRDAKERIIVKTVVIMLMQDDNASMLYQHGYGQLEASEVLQLCFDWKNIPDAIRSATSDMPGADNLEDYIAFAAESVVRIHTLLEVQEEKSIADIAKESVARSFSALLKRIGANPDDNEEETAGSDEESGDTGGSDGYTIFPGKGGSNEA